MRVTAFMKDDGVDTTQLSISDDGTVVTFTRGHEKNRADWVASPEADPNGVERALWAAKTAAPGVVVAAGRRQQRRALPRRPLRRLGARTARSSACPPRRGRASNDIDKGLKPYIRIWGVNSNPVVVARRPQARVRQPPHRSQLHRRLRRRRAQGDLHVAERGLRHAARRGRPTASGSRSSAGPARRSRSSRRTASAASAIRPGPAFNAANAGRGGAGAAAVAAGPRGAGPRRPRRRRGDPDAPGARRRGPGLTTAAFSRRLQPVVLGRRRGDRRRAGVLAQRAGGEASSTASTRSPGAATTSSSSSSPRSGRASTPCRCPR